MATVGNLVFEMSANVARLQQDMEKAKGVVGTAMSGIERGAAAAKTALLALGGTAILYGIGETAKRLLNEAAALDDMAEKTGASVEQLSKLQQVAKLTGASVEGIEGGMIKFNKVLHTVGDESTDASRALKSIGLDFETIKGQDPGAAMQTVANAMNNFRDSGEKTAVALALFGKQGAQLLPFLKDLATYGQMAGKVTAEQAAETEKLQHEMKRFTLESENAKQAILLGMVPAMTDMIRATREAKNESGLLMAAWVALGGVGKNVGDFFAGGDEGRLKSLQTDILYQRKILADIEARSGGGAAAANSRARVAQQEKVNALLAQEVELARRIADAGGFKENNLGGVEKKDPRINFALGEKKEAAKGAAGKSPYEMEIERLKEAAIKVQELGQVEQMLAEIESGRFGALSVGLKNELLALAAAVALNKEDAKVKKEAMDAAEKAQKEADRKLLDEANRVNDLVAKYKEMADPLEKYRQQLTEIDDLKAKGLLSPEAWEVLQLKIDDAMQSAAGMGKALEKTDDASKEYFQKLSSGFESAILDGKKFSDVLRGVAKDMLGIFVRQQITTPLSNAFSSATGGGLGSVFSSLFKGWGPGIADNFDHFAEGGRPPVGKPSWVGEQGMELFVPDRPGTIIPNGALANMGGGGGVSIVQNIHVDSRSDLSSVRAAMAQAKDAAVQEVAALCLQGGSYASAVRGR